MRKSIPEVRQMWLAILEDKRLEEIAMKELIERKKVKQGSWVGFHEGHGRSSLSSRKVGGNKVKTFKCAREGNCNIERNKKAAGKEDVGRCAYAILEEDKTRAVISFNIMKCSCSGVIK